MNTNVVISGETPNEPLKYNGVPVVTTEMLAEKLGVDAKALTKNFNNNKSKYREGIHFFLLQGVELKKFKDDIQNLDVAPIPMNVNRLFLWTEKGAFNHTKSLSTDAAWDAYQNLVDQYFRQREALKTIQAAFRVPTTFAEALRLAAEEAERNQQLLSENNVLRLEAAQAHEEVEEIKEELEKAQPKIEVFEDFFSDKGDVIDMNTAAGIVDMGEHHLFEFLRNMRILQKEPSEWNKPYGRYLRADYFRMKVVQVKIKGEWKNKYQTMVRPKGLAYIQYLINKQKSA